MFGQISRPVGILTLLVVPLAAFAVACGSSDRDPGGDDTDGRTANYDSGASIDEAAAGDRDGGALAPSAPSSGEDPKGASGGGTLPALLDRQIIRTATVSLTVEGVARSFEDVGNIAVSAGGFVSSSSFGNSGDEQVASVTIRVPQAAYQDVLRQLRGLGEVESEQSSANDVTEEFTDLQARIRNLKATEERYVQLLAQAANINEILVVQDRISATRSEIEQIQGRIDLLDNQTALATITTHLNPPVAGPAPDDGGARNPFEVAQEAFEASLVVLLGAATVALAVLAFSWWILPLAALAWIVGRRQVQLQRIRRGSSPPAV